MRAVHELPAPETPSISAELITPSEFLRLKQGAEDAKNLETKAKDKPAPDDSKNETKKPDNAPPPPPPQEVAKVEPPPPPEPPKVAEPPPPPPEPVKPPEPDPIAKKMEEPPPPPPPELTPGPTPDEQKLLEQKIEEQRKADEAKIAAEDAKKKAEEEAKKKAAEVLKKKLADEAKKKRLEELAKKRAEDAKKFDSNKLANLINKAPDDAAPKALLDKDPNKKGQQAAGTSETAKAAGKEAGVANGHDTVLSAREQDLLTGMIKSQLEPCSKMPGGGGGLDTPMVVVEWHVRQDGTVEGEPVVLQPQNSPLFQIAAAASVNAIKNCPLKLPPDKYAAWSKVTWTFDWPKILGLR